MRFNPLGSLHWNQKCQTDASRFFTGIKGTFDDKAEDKLVNKLILCKACHGVLRHSEADNYCICSSCNSANYISNRSAEADNAIYFNSVYSNKSRTVIERRQHYFLRYERIHSFIHSKELRNFQSLLERISEMIIGAEKSVEIGFGYGHELIRYLKSGANIYGLDLSREAVSNFKSKFPEYGERILSFAKFDFLVDVIYSNALFEHLDSPGDFLKGAFFRLNPGGKLIMRLPLIMLNNYTMEQIGFDINFWKPCHRVLYTLKGLNIILQEHGFGITESAPFAYYGYKVMSSMLRHGYRDVKDVRHPYLPIQGLDSEWVYRKILIESLIRGIVCSDFALIAVKAG